VVKRRRGFAVMEPGRQREIASKGGRAAHEKGTAHRWSEQEAKEAGRKGGAASHRNGHRTASREHVATEETPSDQIGNDELTTDELTAQKEPAEDPESNRSPS